MFARTFCETSTADSLSAMGVRLEFAMRTVLSRQSRAPRTLHFMLARSRLGLWEQRWHGRFCAIILSPMEIRELRLLGSQCFSN